MPTIVKFEEGTREALEKHNFINDFQPIFDDFNKQFINDPSKNNILIILDKTSKRYPRKHSYQPNGERLFEIVYTAELLQDLKAIATLDANFEFRRIMMEDIVNARNELLDRICSEHVNKIKRLQKVDIVWEALHYLIDSTKNRSEPITITKEHIKRIIELRVLE